MACRMLVDGAVRVLRAIDSEDGWMISNDLSTKGMSMSTFNRYKDDFVEDGLVEQSHRRDRPHAYRYRLTERGEEVLRQAEALDEVYPEEAGEEHE